ncbi:hypothetical protein TMEC54S_01085 [Thauera mechernichensis]
MRRLPAGGRAGIQHTLARKRRKQPCRPLCARILHRKQAVGEPGQAAYGHGAIEQERIVIEPAYDQPGALEPCQHSVDRRPARIHTDGHGRTLVAGCKRRLPTLTGRGTQAGDPPARKAEPGLLIGLGPGLPLITLTEGVAQHAVDHVLEPGHQLVCGLDRLIDDGVRLLGPLAQTCERNQQQAMDGRRRWRVQETIEHDAATAKITQRGPGQVAHRAPGCIRPPRMGGKHVLERFGKVAATEHCANKLGCTRQGHGKAVIGKGGPNGSGSVLRRSAIARARRGGARRALISGRRGHDLEYGSGRGTRAPWLRPARRAGDWAGQTGPDRQPRSDAGAG